MAASTAASSLALLLSLFAIAATAYATGKIGVDYGRDASNILSPSQVVTLLKNNGVTNVKIYDVDHTVLSAFANSGISLLVALPNEQLSQAANDQSFTDNWVSTNIRPYYPATNIATISVGNEVIKQRPDLNNALVPAMRKLHTSLQKAGLDGSIKISSPFPYDVLSNSYPPSRGTFRSDLIAPVIKPLLDFLDETSSYFMINIYPFITYSDNGGKIPLDYALFEPSAQGITDPNTYFHYSNLLDAQIDALNSAISSVTGANTNRRLISSSTRRGLARRGSHRVVVTETGWPSAGDNPRAARKTMSVDLNSTDLLFASAAIATTNEIGANKDNAAKYNNNLVKRVLNGGGTPLAPDQEMEVYIFSLFNEDLKPGPTSERNFGLFYPNGQKVYDISLNGGGTTGGQTWCVAKANANKDQLQKSLEYACGHGADCGPIQPGARCYDPNTVEAHASWAFSSYYQKNSKSGGTCDFGGVATITSQKPHYGNCDLPATN